MATNTLKLRLFSQALGITLALVSIAAGNLIAQTSTGTVQGTVDRKSVV